MTYVRRYVSKRTSSVKSKEELEAVRQQHLLKRVLQRTDRALCGSDVNVKLVDFYGTSSPAWSDGVSVTLNTNLITTDSVEGLIQVYGLNYHEVCHLLYTPGKTSGISQFVLSHGLMRGFNLLEDQRIETLFTARFPSTIPYLTAASQWVLDPRGADTAYLLIRGRRYLPVEVRRAFRRSFERQDLLPEIDDIIDQYRLLVFPRDVEKGKELLLRMRDVLKELDSMPSTRCHNFPDKKGRAPANQQKKDSAAAEEQSESFEDDAKDDAKDDAEGDKGEGKEKNKQREDSTTNESNDQSSMGDSGGTSEEGKPAEASSAPSYGELTEILAKAVRDVASNRDVTEEMEAKRRTLIKGDGEYTSVLDHGKFPEREVTEGVLASAKKFQERLRQLVEACEPSWDRETASGKLNVGRAMRGGDISTAFDRWDEGDDGYDLEVVVAVDTSGSMCGPSGDSYINDSYIDDCAAPVRAATETAWVLNKSVKAIGGDCTVIAFSEGAALMYGKEDKPTRSMKVTGAAGPTYAYTALEEAHGILQVSKRANRVLIVITDGEWHDGAHCDPLLRDIESMGALTATAYLDTTPFWPGHDVSHLSLEELCHHTQVMGELKDVTDLQSWGKSLVEKAIRRRSRREGRL